MAEQKKIVLYSANNDLSVRWFLRYKEGGKWRKIYGGINNGKTVAERHRLAAVLIEQLQPTGVEPRPKWLSDCIYHLDQNIRGLKPTTIRTYKAGCIAMYKEVGRDINQDKYEKYVRSKNPNTMDHLVWAFNLAFTLAGIPINAKAVKIKLRAQKPARFFSNNIKAMMHDALKTDGELYILCCLQYYCYLRPKEILCLKYSDFDFDRNKIRVNEIASKNNKLQYVRIPSAFVQELKSFVELNRKQPSLFSCQKETYANRHRQLLKSLNLNNQGYSLYSWKHTGAVAYIEAGGKVKNLQSLMRHSTLSMTDKYLRQMGIDDMDASFDVMPKL